MKTFGDGFSSLVQHQSRQISAIAKAASLPEPWVPAEPGISPSTPND
jgi:hypothetical protein